MTTDVIASIGFANVDAAKAEAVKSAFQYWMRQSFPIALIIVLIVAAVDVWRIVQVGRNAGSGVANGIAAPAK